MGGSGNNTGEDMDYAMADCGGGEGSGSGSNMAGRRRIEWEIKPRIAQGCKLNGKTL